MNLPSVRRAMITAAIASDSPDGMIPMPPGSSSILPSSSPAKSANAEPSSSSSIAIVNIWHSRRIFLSSDLRLSPERRETVENALTRAGAAIVPLGPLGYDYKTSTEEGENEEISEESERVAEERESEEEELVEQADVVIMSYRSGKAYVKVCR